MNLKIKIADIEDIDTIEKIANIAFVDTYKEILNDDQISYMLGMMYSLPSLENQIKLGNTFFITYNNQTPIGYASLERRSENTFIIHKLYILPEYKGKGVGTFIFNNIVKYIKTQSTKPCNIEVHVNRYNSAVNFYKRIGMKITCEEDFNIGNGYLMTATIMSLVV